jgi:hypothetical protein
MVDGGFLMRNKELLTLDEDKITSEAMAYAPRVWQNFQELSK